MRVLTGLPDYTTGRIPDEYRWGRKRKEELQGCQVRRVWLTARHKGVLRRVANYMTFMLSSAAYALFCRKPTCDAIFVYETSPVFQALPAILLRGRTKAKLVLYCCDLWPESLKAWNLEESSFIFRAVKAYSGWLYRQCDTVAITSRPFEQYLVDVCGVDRGRIVYLPQHCEDDYSAIACQYEDNGCVDFLFAGNVGAVQDVSVIIKAAALVKTDKLFKVHIVGDGSELVACKRLADSLALGDRVIFHGRHPQEAMREFYKLADCFLLTLRGGDFIGMTLPGKAQGYLSAGRPIVAAIDGAGAAMIADADCGEAVPAGDSEQLGAKIQLIIENETLYRQKGQNGRDFYTKHYTKECFMRSLMNLLERS